MGTTVGRVRLSGMTVIELMVAMLAAAVLALTAGIILVYCFRTLRSNSDAVELQRDVDITTRTLYRAIRSSRRADLNRSHLPSRLTFASRSYYRAGANRLPNAAGTFLVHDPNTAVSGDEQVLVNGTLTACTFVDMTNAIGLSFTVAAQDDIIRVDSGSSGGPVVVHMRNEL
ncbi:MAG: hypothetical protein HQ523_12565 [Lentisphaerae bacterium]|nr:hypothetical protein [Lentisphaerota bacterium]